MEIVEVVLTGHLSVLDLQRSLADLDERARAARGGGADVACVFDCLEMQGYDHDARAYFIDWHGRHRRDLAKVAVVTRRPLWQGVVLAMGLASRTNMRAFDTRRQALSWLRG